MRRIFAQSRKELTQIVRDWRTLALALVLPVVMLLLLSAGLSLTVERAAHRRAGPRRLLRLATTSSTPSAPRSRFTSSPGPSTKSAEEALTSNAARAVLHHPSATSAGTSRAASTHPSRS